MKDDTNRYVLGVEEVAEIFKVNSTTVREWAKSGELPAQKVGKQWFFNKQAILGLQGERDALKILGGMKSEDKAYDIFYNGLRVEVKSSALMETGPRGEYWQFSNFRDKKSDYYLLLGYSKDRKDLIQAFYISTDKLADIISKIKSSLREPAFVLKRSDLFFFKEFSIGTNFEEMIQRIKMSAAKKQYE